MLKEFHFPKYVVLNIAVYFRGSTLYVTTHMYVLLWYHIVAGKVC